MDKIKRVYAKYPLITNLLLTLALAALVLVTTGWFNRGLLKNFGFFEMNDQINYLTTARNLLEYGRLDSSVIFIGALNQLHTKNTLYMPGYPFILAVVFRLFGYGVIQALLPSLLGYIVSAGLTFLIGWKIIGRKAAWLAALMFIFFPLNLLYAFTAMTEITFLTFGLGSFYLFMHIPPYRRWLVGPVLVAAVFLIRETGAFLVFLMAVYMLLEDWRKFWKETVAFCITTFILLVTIYISPLSAGRISLFSNLVGTSLYFDAEIKPFDLTLVGLVKFIVQRGRINWQASLLKPPEVFTLAVILNSIQLGIFYTFLKKRALRYILAVTLLTAIILSLVIFVYDFGSYRGVRTLLFTAPFALVCLAAVLSELIDRIQINYRRAAWAGVFMFLAVWVILSVQTIVNFADRTIARSEHLSIEFFESIAHNNQQVLVTDTFAFPYIEKYFPTQFAYLPANRASMELLMNTTEIGTVVIPAKNTGRVAMDRDALIELGFELQQTVEFQGEQYLVFREP